MANVFGLKGERTVRLALARVVWVVPGVSVSLATTAEGWLAVGCWLQTGI
jgi:hypothetical protein